MKLNNAQVERTLSQFPAQVLPESHQAVPQLASLFGEHTFFLDGSGLSVIEPESDVQQPGVRTGRVVHIANWKDDELTALVPHPPEPTDVLVVIEGPPH